MFSRPMLFLGVLVAAVVVPYVLLDEHLAETARGQWQRLVGQKPNAQEDGLGDLSRFTRGEWTPAATPAARYVPIEQVFRFDLTPQSVSSQWSRVSTVHGDREQLGMRVALVSGTGIDDIAGSLTYYFDPHHQLQRITFEGVTSDPRRLLAAVVTPNGLQSQPTTSLARYTAGNPAQPSSEVLVKQFPLLTANSRQPQIEVSVDLRRSDVRGWQEKAEREPEKKLLPSIFRRW